MEVAPAASTVLRSPYTGGRRRSRDLPRIPDMKHVLAIAAAAGLVASLALVQRGAAGPGSLGAFFFGPKLVRAEVVLADGGTVHDYRVDRGRIRAYAAGTLSLLERDGTTVAVPVAPDADVRVGGRAIPVNRLRRMTGRIATTIRDGDQPAATVQVGGA